jgi:uncharacterized protein YjiS (DUF1127 family)
MNALASRHPAVVVLEALARSLTTLAAVLARAAAACDRRIAARRRMAADLAALAAMSDRELADFGVERGSVAAVAAGAWRRDR